ncbi:hypothetical protein FNV43_RR15762 [Rhamnella rubrinervis]|uniref:Ubiquitin-like domain-containing protein n=1 Tax=Rhamnella rubrinervis TaxID=2594499 RepID=A0A8K0ED57_9ROSA|nr:hypothetical protein FNV43_RR15762 [Rhamnella rubrinervis]
MEVPGPASFLQEKQKIKEIANVEEDRNPVLQPRDPKVSIVAKSSNREDEPINVRETQSAAHLRNKISRRWGIFPPSKITLTRLFHAMEDDHLLSDYYVCEGAEVNVVVHVSPR